MKKNEWKKRKKENIINSIQNKHEIELKLYIQLAKKETNKFYIVFFILLIQLIETLKKSIVVCPSNDDENVIERYFFYC